MVLQVFPDAGFVENDRDAHFLQLGGWSDAGKQQRLRRSNGAGRQDHLALAARNLELAVLAVAHANCTLAVENDLVGQAAGFKPQVLTLEHRLEKPPRRRPAPATV